MQETDPMERLHVADAMQSKILCVAETEPFGNLRDLVEERGCALVVNTQRILVGIVTQPDVRAHDGAPGMQKLTAADVAARPVITARPEETLQTAVRRMSQLGLRQLAVVTTSEAGPEPVGVLRRSDALAAYVETLVSGDKPERAPARRPTDGDVAPTPTATTSQLPGDR
jgi:CBS domain-containing protein